MSRRRPLQLSKAQLDAVMDAATGLRPADRCKYLEGIADELLPRKTFTTADVQQAVRKVLGRLLGAAA